MGNTVMAFGPGSPTADPPPEQPLVTISPVVEDTPVLGSEVLRTKLNAQIQKNGGCGPFAPRLSKPRYFRYQRGQWLWCVAYRIRFIASRDQVHVADGAAACFCGLQPQLEAYIQSEFNAYTPYEYNHTGLAEGAPREIFITPDDVSQEMATLALGDPIYRTYEHWSLNPFTFYVLWKYAEHFGDAAGIFAASKAELAEVPEDSVLEQFPHVHNAFIAGYIGYLNLQMLAGEAQDAAMLEEKDRLLALRADKFTTESTYGELPSDDLVYCNTLNVARNYMHMVPELAEYLRNNAFDKVAAAVDESTAITPHWFASNNTDGYAENAINILQDTHAPFLARAWITKIPARDLHPYVDVPGFDRGNLLYIHKIAVAVDRWIHDPEGEPAPSGSSDGESSKDSGGCGCRIART